MLFSSVVFIFLFLPLLIVFYFWAGKGSIKVKNFILLIFSLLFYTWGEGFLVLIMLAVVVINYIAGILIERTTGAKQKIILIISIILTLSFYFSEIKYIDPQQGRYTENIKECIEKFQPTTVIYLCNGQSLYHALNYQ